MQQEKDKIILTAVGKLNDSTYHSKGSYALLYTFEQIAVTITAYSENGGILQLTLICSAKDSVQSDGKRIVVTKGKTPTKIQASGEILLPEATEKRNFMVIGGFETLPLTVRLTKNVAVSVKISL